MTQEFFNDKTLKPALEQLVNLMQIFALSGQKVDGPAFYKLITLFKGYIPTNNKGTIEHIEVRKRLIGLIWTMIYRDNELQQVATLRRQQYEQNPMIPRLLESLYQYKRQEPLSKLEHLQLFQINIWIQNKVENGRLPEEFLQCIPQEIQIAAEERYTEYDKPTFKNVQTDIAKHLLKLRVTFQENQKIEKTYRSDIKLLKKNIAMFVKSEDKAHKHERN